MESSRPEETPTTTFFPKYELADLQKVELNTIEDNGKRFYVNEKGEKYPSVTTVTGLLSNEQIKLWRERVGEEYANKVSTRASRRGTLFHSLCENYLLEGKNEPNEFHNPLQEAMFKSIQNVLDNILPVSVESALYSDTLKMAGRVDCVGYLEDRLCVIDFKTASAPKEEHHINNWLIQTTAYAMMVEEMTGIDVDNIVILCAVEGHNAQMWVDEPSYHVEELCNLRNRYTNLYGI